MEKNIAALLREDTKTIGVRFFNERFNNENKTLLDLEQYTNLSAATYTYVTTEDFKEGDYAIVFVSDIPKVALVVRVDSECMIDPQENIEFKWVVSKVNIDSFEENQRKNEVILDVVTQAYKKNLRAQFQDIVMKNLDRKDKVLLKNVLKRN